MAVRPTLALVLLPFAALAGCVDTDFDIKVANASDRLYFAHVWINGTSDFHGYDSLSPGQNHPVGHFEGRVGQYTLDVLATNGTHRLKHHEARELSPSLGSLQITLHRTTIEVTQGVRARTN